MPKFNSADTAADSLVGARKLRAVTPHASTALPGGVCDWLFVGDEGAVTVAVVAEDDTDPVTLTVLGPCRLHVRAKAVRVAGTTATDLVAAY